MNSREGACEWRKRGIVLTEGGRKTVMLENEGESEQRESGKRVNIV